VAAGAADLGADGVADFLRELGELRDGELADIGRASDCGQDRHRDLSTAICAARSGKKKEKASRANFQ
jgi:hypothetical protein